MTSAIRTQQLGRRYGRRWALQDCSLDVPAGRVIGLVGPNGAGKSTLLHLIVGLLRPTAGRASVLGVAPGSPDALSRVGFVAQDKPLYRTFTVAEQLQMGRWLNPRFDLARAQDPLHRLYVPLDQRIGRLSGGQRSQVALALALGKRPDLLVLDEPVAELDPLARRQFLAVLMEEVADSGLTVLLSSHVLTDLEHACDYLVLLSRSRVQLSAPSDELLNHHLILSGPRSHVDALSATCAVVQASYTHRQATLLVRASKPVFDPVWTARPATLEELVLAYMSQPDRGSASALSVAGSSRVAS